MYNPYKISNDEILETMYYINTYGNEIYKWNSYLMDKMGLSDIPIILRLDLPYASDALGRFDAHTITIYLYIGSIIQYVKYSMEGTESKEKFHEYVLNSIINILIHELSHVCQNYYYINRVKVVNILSSAETEHQNYKNSYMLYKNFKQDLIDTFGVDPLDVPFTCIDRKPKREYSICGKEEIIIGILRTYSKLFTGSIYRDIYNNSFIDVCFVTTDIYCNILNMDYIGFIKYNGLVTEDALQKLQTAIISHRITDKTIEYVYRSYDISKDHTRIALFNSISTYCPITGEGRKVPKEIWFGTKDDIEREYNLRNNCDKMLKRVNEFIESKEEGK